MWFFKNDKSKDWASNLRYITSFDTVEDFWALYNHILPASKLGVGCDYSLFKGTAMDWHLLSRYILRPLTRPKL